MTPKRLTLCGVLTAAALSIFVLEAQLPPLLPIPGIKLGLSNLITLFALLYLSPLETVFILLARILLGGFLIGNPSTLLYSLLGGIACLGIELLLLYPLKVPYIWAVSAVGAIVHNLMQLSLAILITKAASLLWYLPFLLIAGVLTGLFTGYAIHLFDKHAGSQMRRLL